MVLRVPLYGIPSHTVPLPALVHVGNSNVGLQKLESVGDYETSPSQLAADMDDNLFANILNNPHHVLHTNFFRTKQIIAIISDLVVTLCH